MEQTIEMHRLKITALVETYFERVMAGDSWRATSAINYQEGSCAMGNKRFDYLSRRKRADVLMEPEGIDALFRKKPIALI
jgi:hypothetical protein